MYLKGEGVDNSSTDQDGNEVGVCWGNEFVVYDSILSNHHQFLSIVAQRVGTDVRVYGHLRTRVIGQLVIGF